MMKFLYSATIFFSFVILLTFSSCLSGIRLGASKTGVNLYETFYVGEQGTQYYVKPLSFSGENSEELSLDMTFRYKDQIKDSVVVNFSVFSDKVLKKIDSFVLRNAQNSVQSTDVSLLFNSKQKKKVQSRFVVQLPLEEVYQLFQEENWIVEIQSDNNKIVFVSSGKASKSVRKLNDVVFSLF